MMEEGVNRLLRFWELKKSGVICATSPIPQDRPINLPQISATALCPYRIRVAPFSTVLVIRYGDERLLKSRARNATPI